MPAPFAAHARRRCRARPSLACVAACAALALLAGCGDAEVRGEAGTAAPGASRDGDAIGRDAADAGDAPLAVGPDAPADPHDPHDPDAPADPHAPSAPDAPGAPGTQGPPHAPSGAGAAARADVPFGDGVPARAVDDAAASDDAAFDDTAAHSDVLTDGGPIDVVPAGDGPAGDGMGRDGLGAEGRATGDAPVRRFDATSASVAPASNDDQVAARAREAVDAALGGQRIVRFGEDRPRHERGQDERAGDTGPPGELAAPAEPPQVVAARTALELDPVDAPALHTLAEHERARGDPDRALFWVDRFLEHGGDAQVGVPLAEALDPLRAERIALLEGAGVRLREDADVFARRSWWLCAASRLDAAAALGDPLAVPAREELLRKRDAVRALARFGAPLPPELAADPRTSPQRIEDLDSKAAESGRPHAVSERHVEVVTPIGYTLAWQAARLLEATWQALDAEYDVAGLPRRVSVHIAPTKGDFERARRDSGIDVGAWATGYYDRERDRIEALDVRELGAPRQRLFGLLAHELAHVFLARATRGDHALPVWLDEGLAMQHEGADVLGDGEVALDLPSAEHVHEAALALSGGGGRVVPLDELLTMTQPDVDAYPWLYALVAFLRHGEDDAGRLLWADRFDRLLEDHRRNVIEDPLRHFEDVIVAVDDEPRAAVIDARGFESLWHEWIRWQDASLRGDGVALHRLLTMARSHVDAGRLERARSTLRDALAVAPDSRPALAMWIEAHAQEDPDAAMLGALNLASASTPGAASIRFEPCHAMDADLGERLAADDAAWRAQVDALADDYVTRGFPRAAVRLLERVLAAWPLDGAWRARADQIQREHALPTRVRHRLEAVRTLDGLHGDRGLFEASGWELVALAHDRAQPASLRGLAKVAPPYRVEVTLELLEGARDERARAGLTFAAPESFQDGGWGVFATGDGHIVFASQRNLEWSTEPIATRRGTRVRLAVEVTETDFEPFLDGRSLGRHPLLGRAAEGWLGLHAQRVDVRLSELVVLREAGRDPHANWATLGRR